jgi:hypothetical protein
MKTTTIRIGVEHPHGTFTTGRKHKKTWAVVEPGDTFAKMGWFWTVTSVADDGRTFCAVATTRSGSEVSRAFSAEVGAMYYGEPDPSPDEDSE